MAVTELRQIALARFDNRRRADFACRHPADATNGPVVEPLVDRRGRADVAVTLFQLVDVGDERSVQRVDVPDSVFQHRRIADHRSR